MEVPQSTYLKIVIFFLLGLVFALGMIAYSNAWQARSGALVEDYWPAPEVSLK